LVPSICLLTGLGAAVLLARLSPAARRRRVLGVAVGLLALLGGYLIARDVIKPYRVWGDVQSREFARWFWREYGQEADLVCVTCDLGLAFEPKLWTSGMSAVYLFHRAMFADPRPDHEVGRRPSVVGRCRPVRLVFFDDLPRDNQCFDQWLARILTRCEVGPPQYFTVSPGKPGELWLRDRYIVLEVHPRDRFSRALTAAQAVLLGARATNAGTQLPGLDIDLAKVRQSR
jgi:hypothetical protein